MPVRLERCRLGWTAAAIDVLVALACYIAAYRLRFEGPDFARFFFLALRVFPHDGRPSRGGRLHCFNSIVPAVNECGQFV